MILNEKEIIENGLDAFTVLVAHHLRKTMLDHDLEITHEEILSFPDSTSTQHIYWEVAGKKLIMRVVIRKQSFRHPPVHTFEISPTAESIGKVPEIQHHPLYNFQRGAGRFYRSGGYQLELTLDGDTIAKRGQIKELFGYLKLRGKTLSTENAHDGYVRITWEGRKPFDMLLIGSGDIDSYVKVYDDYVQEMILKGFIPTQDPLVFL